jgi:hypothetical protein
MIPSETIATGGAATCPDCGITPKLEVLRSNAYYLGTQCSCGPYSRESPYYKTRKDAEVALALLEPDPTKNKSLR